LFFFYIIDEDTFDICKASTRTYDLSAGVNNQNNFQFYIKSTDFPAEYASSLDCTCTIDSLSHQGQLEQIPPPLKLEVLWFSLQDNDYLSLFNKNLTGWINPTFEMPLLSSSTKIRFLTDDALAYKGFWLKISSMILSFFFNFERNYSF
jgi:hypothetical protein